MNVLPFDRKSQVLSLLVEGCSIRSISRVTGTQKNTILKLLVDSGREAMEILDAQLVNLKPRYVQVDEIWAYVGKKQKRVTDIDSPEFGDQYVFVAMDSETKLAMSYLVGKRNYENALSIMKDLQYRAPSAFQLSTDAFTPYFNAVDTVFGTDVHYGQIHKVYKEDGQGQKRYSPAQITEVIIKSLIGEPKRHKISTSHVERQNLTMRMQMRRFTRLTNAFSKKLENLRCAVALHFFHYNFMRIHQTLRVTPAMEAGVTNRIWGWRDLLEYKKNIAV